MCADDEERLKEQAKAATKAKVERGFLYIKHIFGFRKVRYLGLAKNHAKLLMLFTTANVMIAKRYGKTCIWHRPRGKSALLWQMRQDPPAIKKRI